MISLKCPTCGQTQRLPDEVLGQKINCPSCGAAFRVGSAKPAAPGAGAAPAPAPAATVTLPPVAPSTTTALPAASPAPSMASTPPPAPPPGAFDQPVPARKVKPSRPDPAEEQPRGLPAWAFACIGAAAALVIGGIGTLGWVYFGSRPAKVPDPSIDVIQGVASSSPAPATTPAALPVATVPGSQAAPPTVAAAGNAGTRWSFNSAAPGNSPPAQVGLAPSAPVAPVASAAPASAGPAPATPPPANGPLTTAQIVARWEPSVALVRGHASIGTGFVVRPGIIATNAHVIDEEFISSLEVQFPSAPEGKKGPLSAELLYEDARRDIAFLSVPTDLPPTEIAPSYNFTKGEDILAIGNPGLGEDVVLENAISRGVMSSKTVIDGMNFLQLNIAINPGNSGGPIFDSSGRVIGVATLKSSKAEAMAFCIPAEELNAALNQLGTPLPEVDSRHRSRVAFKMLTAAGAMYGIGLEIRAALLVRTQPGARPNFVPTEPIAKLDETIKTLDEKLFSLVDQEIPAIKADESMAQGMRDRLEGLWKTYQSMKILYTHPNRQAAQYVSEVQILRARLLKQVQLMQRDLNMAVPAELVRILKVRATDDVSPTIVTRIVPSHVQSRIMRGPTRLAPRGPINPRASVGNSARDRMQSARDRMRSRMQNNR